LGYAQILGRSQTLSAQERQGINVISQCGAHLLTLINDVLDLSKVEARKLDLVPVALHLPALLQSVVEMCSIKAQQKGIDFLYQPSPQLPEGMEVDEKRLRQVLINLLGNAIKFTEQGAVTLRVEVVSRTDEQVELLFQIIDTGVGIAEADLTKLFEAFEQVGDQRKQSEGTGLGLAISQRIVQLMGSQIQVTSTLNQGSEFCFTVGLPLVSDWSQQTANQQLGGIVGYEGDRRQILVIDDRWENRSVVKNLLEPLGFAICEAENGQTGLEKLRSQQPDLVITDLAMPVMDGFEFLKQVRNSDDLQASRIIVSSASVGQQDQQMALDAGGDDFLSKPIDARLLFQAVETHLDLDWRYAVQDLQTSSDDRPTELVLPPHSVLSQLLETARTTNMKALRTQIEDLVSANPAYGPFAQPILRFSQQFMAEEIEALLTEHLTQSDPTQQTDSSQDRNLTHA
ncbi:MAG: ATP-binding protein, partial [Cyanobacteria bacterium P01_D01_bin.1]